jgi:hypothetical protein
MTELEMRTLFEQRYNNSSFTNHELGDDELYLYLNLEIERFVNTRFTGNNVRKQPFESDQKRIDDLRTLLITSNEINTFNTINEIPNGREITLPSDYRFYVNSYCNIDKIVNDIPQNGIWIINNIIRNKEIDKFIKTLYHSPIINNPKVFFRDSDKLTILIDEETTLNSFKIQYIKQPVKIENGVDCDLPDHTHEEIVEGAVSLALETSESSRSQTEQNKLLTKE